MIEVVYEEILKHIKKTNMLYYHTQYKFSAKLKKEYTASDRYYIKVTLKMTTNDIDKPIYNSFIIPRDDMCSIDVRNIVSMNCNSATGAMLLYNVEHTPSPEITIDDLPFPLYRLHTADEHNIE